MDDQNKTDNTVVISVGEKMTEESKAENQSAQKVLSPEEQVALEKRRATFKALHDYFIDDEIYAVGADTSAMMALIDSAFQKKAKEMSVSDLGLIIPVISPRDEKMPENKKDLEDLITILKDSSVQDASDFLRVLGNAVDHERIQKTKMWTVKDLDIQIL